MAAAASESGPVWALRFVGGTDHRLFPASLYYHFRRAEKHQPESGAGSPESGRPRMVSLPYGNPASGSTGAGQRFPAGGYQLPGRLRQSYAGRRQLSRAGNGSLYTGDRCLGSTHGRHAFRISCDSYIDCIFYSAILSGKEFLCDCHRQAGFRPYSGDCRPFGQMDALCFLPPALSGHSSDNRSGYPLCLHCGFRL